MANMGGELDFSYLDLRSLHAMGPAELASSLATSSSHLGDACSRCHDDLLKDVLHAVLESQDVPACLYNRPGALPLHVIHASGCAH